MFFAEHIVVAMPPTVEDFEPDEADTVELINGERMPWEQVKRDGIDYIALYYVNEKGKPVQILDAELA